VTSRLRALEVPTSSVQVEVREGAMRLQGTLSSAAEARLVALCVRGLDGVVGVDASELQAAEAGS